MNVDSVSSTELPIAKSTFKPIQNEPTVIHSFHSQSIKVKLRTIFSNHKFLRLMPFATLYITAGYIPAVFMPSWGAEYLTDCNINNEECTLNYTKYNAYSALFTSISGMLAFTFGGVIGRASDAFGRKLFLYMNVILSALQYAPLMFWPILWIRFAFLIPAGLNSNDNSYTPIMIAYISDVLPEHQRTFGYSVSYAFAALGLIFGVFLSILATIIFSSNANFILITILNCLQLFYLKFFISESLPLQNRKPFTFKNLNPLKPLMKCCFYNRVILWISVVTFFISLPETGVLELCLIYILDQMQINNEKDANILTSIYLLSSAAGLVVGNLVVLPKLQARHFSKHSILVISAVIFAISFVLLSMLTWIKSLVFVILPAFVLAIGFMAFATSNGILSQHLSKTEQGVGFGVVYAVRSIAWTVAPITFALIYNYFKSIGFPAAVYVFAIILMLIAIVLIVYPLKSALLYAESQEIQCMDGNNDNIMQHINNSRNKIII